MRNRQRESVRSLAVMRKEQKDIDGLGPLGIIREAFKLFLTHSKFSMLIQLTLMLPVAILVVTTDYMSIVHLYLPEQNPRPPGTAPVPFREFGISFNGNASGLQQALTMLAVLLISAVGWIVPEVAKSLSSSAIMYAVGLKYTGQSISFRDVLRVSIPWLWMRLTVTNIYEVLLSYCILIVHNGGSLLLIQIHGALPFMLLGVTALAVLAVISLVCLALIFMLAGGVSVLEKDYGWAAVRRTQKLLKGRVIVAIFFQLLWLLPAFITLGFQQAFRSAFRYLAVNGEFPRLIVIALIFGTSIYICWMSFFWHMTSLCAGVQYVSFKAYHNEDLAESIHEKQVRKGGYERVGSGSDDAKVEGKQADTFV